MLDLLVKLSASYKLSPSSYMLTVKHPTTGAFLKYCASETIGSLGVTTVYLVSKEAEKLRLKEKKTGQSFDASSDIFGICIIIIYILDNNNNNNCLKSNIQCIEIRVQWTVYLGSSHINRYVDLLQSGKMCEKVP